MFCPRNSQPREQIFVCSLELRCLVGVPDEERALPQRLLLDLELQPERAFVAMEDDLGRTVDYAKLTADLVKLASSKPRKLIETLAVDLADWIFRHHPVTAVSLRIRKFILPDTEFVGVCLAWRRKDFEKFAKLTA